MIGVEDLWLIAASQSHLKGIQRELCVKAVRERPTEHVSVEEIHDRHQVEEALLERDVGDDGGPHLIHSRVRVYIHQAVKALGSISWNRCAGFPLR